MTIVGLMKTADEGVRVVMGDRWLFYGTDSWVVMEHKYGAKKSRVLVTTPDEEIAVKILIRDEE